MTTPTPSDSPPALWNPNAAACWSLLFSPAFGAFLHARNADSLGRTDEAKANRVWFYASVAFYGLVVISTFIPAIPDILFKGAGIGLLVGWYASLGRKQIQYVKDTWHDRYQRKSWTKPLLVWFGCFVGVVLVAGILPVVVDRARHPASVVGRWTVYYQSPLVGTPGTVTFVEHGQVFPNGDGVIPGFLLAHNLSWDASGSTLRLTTRDPGRPETTAKYRYSLEQEGKLLRISSEGMSWSFTRQSP